MKQNFKLLKNNSAVSEILGTILLVGISVILFSTVYISLFTTDLGDAVPTVNIAASIEGENLVLHHCGGNDLAVESEIVITDKSNKNNNIVLKDLMNSEDKKDGLWNIDEKIICDLKTLPDIEFERYDKLVVNVVDSETSSMVMRGDIQESRTSDLKITFDKQREGLSNIWWINTTITNFGPSEAKEVVLKSILSPGLVLLESEVKAAEEYDIATNRWFVGDLGIGESKDLNVKVEASPVQPTQLAIILDGTSPEALWNEIVHGINQSIQNGIIPHNGAVELTVIQYGADQLSGGYVPRAKKVIGPCILGDCTGEITCITCCDCYKCVGRAIENLDRMGGDGISPDNSQLETFVVPMSSAFKKATMELTSASAKYWDPDNRQVIYLFASNVPNCYIPERETGVDSETLLMNLYENLRNDYPGITIPPLPSWAYDYNYVYPPGKTDALIQRNYMIEQLMMDRNDSEVQDEINIAIFPLTSESAVTDPCLIKEEEAEWVLNHLAYPQPGFNWTNKEQVLNENGWCRSLDPNYDPENADITAQVHLMSSEIFKLENNTIELEIVSTKYMDPNPEDNKISFTISSTNGKE
jgi:FlaG/FlaF family flagellin (archaellin)